jgi:hypothetical protein
MSTIPKRRYWLKFLGLIAGVSCLLLGLIISLFYLSCRMEHSISQPGSASICNSPFSRFVPQKEALIRYQAIDSGKSIQHVTIPQHPFMAANLGNNMHNDAYMSDTYEASGPIGLNPVVHSRTQGFGGYGTLAFDRARRLVGVYGDGRSFQLELMDPYTLQELASFKLPPRPSTFLLQGVLPWEYIGAGIYFYLDNQDQAIVPTTLNTIEVVQVPAPESQVGFELVREYDLSKYVVPMHWPKQDSVVECQN